MMLKINEIKGKTPTITGLGTEFALNAGDNKALSVSNLVKKTDLIQKYQILKRNILILPIIMSLYLMQDKRKTIGS